MRTLVASLTSDANDVKMTLNKNMTKFVRDWEIPVPMTPNYIFLTKMVFQRT